ncbi:MAG: type II secretion system GspH family protein [Roseburia sp.]|nr:type II secretion system GspH family protein [Roseburia sp.]
MRMKLNNKGFSLVELLLAIVISTIVFGAVTALMAFSSNSMRDTEARIEVQNQAKDALNHMESYILESERAYWDDSEKLLILFTDEKEAKQMIKELEGGSKTLADIKNMASDSYAYWFKDVGGSVAGGEQCVYFGKCSSSTSSPGATPAPAASLPPGATATPMPSMDPTVQIVDVSTLATLDAGDLKNYLLAEDVMEFDCETMQNEDSKKYLVDINMKLDNDIAPEYSCGKKVYLRNQ